VAAPLPFAESEVRLLTALLRARIRFMVVQAGIKDGQIYTPLFTRPLHTGHLPGAKVRFLRARRL